MISSPASIPLQPLSMITPYYKYRSLYVPGNSGKQINPFTESIFKKAEIYFSAPSAFNDPFDCHLRTHATDSTDAEWEQYFDNLIKAYPSNSANLLTAKNQKIWKTNNEVAENIGKDQLRIHYDESSVFCLAKKGNSIPMFSYYAEGHTGIAIEFSFSDENVPCGIPYAKSTPTGVPYEGRIIFRDVEYPKVFPELNYLRIRNSD